jgi:hypothetical protein
MNRHTYRKRVTHGLLMGLLVAGVALADQPASPGERPQAPSDETRTGSGASAGQPPAEKPAARPGVSGMTIHIDPKTGALLKEPAPGAVPLQLTPQLRNALSTSHQGLVETPSLVPGGGVKIDLQGRFQSPLLITIDADGKTKIQHLHEMPESGDEK